MTKLLDILLQLQNEGLLAFTLRLLAALEAGESKIYRIKQATGRNSRVLERQLARLRELGLIVEERVGRTRIIKLTERGRQILNILKQEIAQ